LKIYRSKKVETEKNQTSDIEKLIINDLNLKDKMNQLINSIQIVKLCPNGENELIRILFEGLGKKVYFPRKGDNSERFDAIVDFDNYKSVVEIEIPSTEILDAPRNLLDDYAVQKQRKKEKDKPIVPLVICWDLPNKRTDYWNVIKDINSILKIKIKTISILALALHYWTETPLDLESDDYYLEYSKCHMNSESEIFQKANISIEDYPGYFTPYK
jgi:hypothetical protein